MTEMVVQSSKTPAPLVAPDSIVVGVGNRSHGSERALWEAALWGARHGSDITLLTGVGRRHHVADAEVSHPFRRQHALHAVNGAAHRLARSTDLSQRIHTAVVDRPAKDSLIAASTHASLIVLQRDERQAGGLLRTGSTVAAVLAHATCPVLVVHADDQITMRRGVLLVVDEREPAGSGLDQAFEEAGVRGVTLSVAECRIGPRGIVASPDRRHARDLAEAAIGEQLRATQRRFPEVRMHQPVLSVSNLASLLSLARDCELLVMPGREPERRGGGLGSVTRHLLAEARCPVLVVPPGWAATGAVGQVAASDRSGGPWDPEDDGGMVEIDNEITRRMSPVAAGSSDGQRS